MVDQLYDRSFGQDQGKTVRTSAINSLPLENISKMIDAQFAEQNNYIKGNFVSVPDFEGYQRDNAHNMKEMKNTIDLLYKNIQNNNDLLSKIEVMIII